MLEIQGHWVGYYTYGEEYGEWAKDKRVPFRMIIERGITEFVGRIFESAEHDGIDDDILIKGRQNDDEIEFVKYYTKQHFADDSGKTISLESEHPSVVHYKGTYDSSKKRFKGEWDIPFLYEDEDGVLHSCNDTGTWVLWREIDP
jgi:hypothetical protein